jgi:glycosyltransferase involved in cell wall biosynthesis
VLQVVASSSGGGATHVRDLAVGLDPARFAVEVVMPNDGGHVSGQEFERLGIPLHPLRLEAGVSGAALRDLRRLISRFQVVHAHGARAAFWIRCAAPTLPAPRPRIIYSIHGFTAPFDVSWRRALLRLIESALAPLTDVYVAVCAAERDALAAAHWLPSKRVTVVRNGVALQHFVPADRGESRTRLGLPAAATLVTTVCRLNRPRDFETLLTAFRQAVDSEAAAHLLIVGSGPWEQRIRQRCSALGLNMHVTLGGQRDDIAAVLAATDIFVLTSSGGDGLPIGILEAMAAALPVVATATDGIPEAVVDCETGFLVRSGDAGALSTALLRLMREPQARARFGAAGRARAEREFDVRVTIAALAEVYERAVSAPTWNPVST